MPRAFTLIELLVVVTIIVILLALLTPALDKALYSAELAVCGAKVRGIAGGVTIYTNDFKRAYPYKQGIDRSDVTWRPNLLWLATGNNQPLDERVPIRPYIGSINKQLQCPFLTEMNIDVNDINSRGAGEIGWASYQMWWGWRFAGQKGMNKLGDEFSWTADGKEQRFDILANDYDLVSPPQDENFAIGSHPDKGPQTMVESIVNNEPYVGVGVGIGGAPRSPFIWSRWQGSYQRGTIDMNFARTDNSVARVDDVRVQRSLTDSAPDERMARVPEGDMDQWPIWRNHLPTSGQ